MQIAVSYLKSYYSKEKTLNLIEKTNADYIHVDLMDGSFVYQKNFIIDEVLTLLKNHHKPLDIHLMVYDPIIYIDKLSTLKPNNITFHLEATKDIIKTISIIKEKNIKVGLAIKPETNLLELMPYLTFIDYVLIMSVEPGLGGQQFLPPTVARLNELINYRKVNNLKYLIAIDGGINNETINLVKNADIIVSGSYICNSTNYQTQINNLRN